MVECWVIIIIIILVSLSGLFSGLTLGLLGLDKTELERKIKLGDKKAKKVYSVRKRGNLLLCTLLLGNVAVNSAIALFLGSIANGVFAGVIATGLIVIFGEIIPQATVSRYALTVGAKTVWIVKGLIFILYPICWPIAKVLDKILGEEMPTIWSRHELEEIIRLHEDSSKSSIDSDEEKIILGALSFSKKNVEDVMTPRIVVFSLEVDAILTEEILKNIKDSGFTRIPIYKKKIDNLVGILYSKDLVGVKKGAKVKDIYRTNLLEVTNKKNLDSVLNQFIKERIHLAIVFNRYKEFVGIITMEDIIEEILRKEIVDEDDRVVDLQKVARKKVKKKISKKK
ncbi:DUF21 domain-containing protein [Candidatus Pacearchaeota archaeon]|nr:DUF21 domain-containing protein [Candidatus Pacearchaeota archaeon]